MYPLKISEEELKNKVARDFFTGFNHTQILGRIDFCISYSDKTLFEHINFLWAEAKKGKDKDIIESFVQLILTIGKERSFEDTLPPLFLGAFDCEKIAFIPYHEVMHVFSQNDFNWNVTPSDHTSKEFKQLYTLTKDLLESKQMRFYFESDSVHLREFIAANFTLENNGLSKIQITKNNFVNIYLKWVNVVKPAISIDWDAESPYILDSDFFLADLLSYNNTTKDIYENLKILLMSDYYKVKLAQTTQGGKFSFTEVNFNDRQKAHTQFWNIYERPPKEEFWDYILERRDLLVPQDIREYKGAFFTPRVWVEKSQSYLAKALGENYQDEYYIWDCAAGTGNLLAGLSDKYKIFASTLDSADIDILKERIKNGANLLDSHVFQFDFLNDSFFDEVDSKGTVRNKSKLPKDLQEILKDEAKRKKLIIYINPPYAEATTKRTIASTGKNKDGVATTNLIYEKYKGIMNGASNELFAQFFMRIYKELDSCVLASFATLKYLNSTNFIKFRNIFKAKFLKGFICPAYTFDNVRGSFSIGFLVWDTAQKVELKKVRLDIFETGNEKIGVKKINSKLPPSINRWIKNYDKAQSGIVGYMGNSAPDFQHNDQIYISNNKGSEHFNFYKLNVQNIFFGTIYFAARYCIRQTWINNRDQFLTPKKAWKKDKEFHNDCLAFTIFHSKNRITSREGTNHFIPFREKEVDSKGIFESHFLSDFIAGKLKADSQNDNLFGNDENSFIPTSPLNFSEEASAVFEAGKNLWRYYHAQDFGKNDIWHTGDFAYLNDYNANASLYDIKAYFQGFNEKGRMNARSEDSHYNDLIANLRYALESLASKIAKKVYEYEFLES
ncbi:hypothetical protein CQA49_02960 [Helicobacter sp. MIT 00-7814]|uniref:hypothetical protein n=1 Tax=unclassified Helicobacter TaxID=2593540 RepID=UPI000E1F6AE9|nr:MULTISPECIES: hypothetical protein [unclassified Helicobacter]RDU55871.1 hypothetical protein CQA49_02960 [Helicobacter sp. MIT 00-7814]RDU56829.1 hypothetical protein CQA37_01655 [Helicobacter sp. MIT 99-10781]